MGGCSVEYCVKGSQELSNIKAVSRGTLLQCLVLGAHATNTAKIKGSQDFGDGWAFAHCFMECHIFRDNHCASPVKRILCR
jgi:hypothetical protein